MRNKNRYSRFPIGSFGNDSSFSRLSLIISGHFKILTSSRFNVSSFQRFFVFTFLRFTLLLFTFHLSPFTLSYSQVLTEDLNNPIYDFIDRMAVKKIIEVNQSVKPYSKKQIEEWLKQIKNSEFRIQNLELSRVEIDELEWYLDEYDLERGENVSKLGQYNYLDDHFKFRLYPVFGYELSTTGDASGYSKWVGAHFEGAYDNLSLMFEYLDIGQFGDNVDRQKYYTNKRGYFNNYQSKDGIEFSDIRGQISYDWNWGNISLRKDYNNWGHGKYGQLILSDKPASYPHIKLQLNPAKWLSINYIHGWLNSYVIDSSKSFYYGTSSVEPRLFEEYKNKFIAANYISIMPYSWLTFSMGNSFIYSGDLRPEMFIPVLYYKAMDHNTGRGAVGDGNGILHFDFGINYPKNYSIYGTVIFDVLNIREWLDGITQTQWIGYTLGGSAVDVGISYLDLRIEYTKINPWLYENKYDITNYKHLNYSLGHWIGQNADLLTAELQYTFIRGMHASLMWQLFRKGDILDIYYAYNDPPKLDFLYGDKRNENRIKLTINYEFMNNIYLNGYWSYSEINDEKDGRTQSFLLGSKNSFSLSLSYGMR